ncbi:MAG: 30S ribosome-binding factor RbfA [Clostridiales bacterium]|nr:30S ribosome-binding factor RbfA [Clostridiales bacterium]
MSSHKILRLSQDIRHEISGIIMHELKDPRITGMLSVTRTEVSGDMSYCKVYISSMDGIESAKTAIEGLESAKGYIKRQLASRLKMRKCPDLIFIADDSIEYSAGINKLLKDIEK